MSCFTTLQMALHRMSRLGVKARELAAHAVIDWRPYGPPSSRPMSRKRCARSCGGQWAMLLPMCVPLATYHASPVRRLNPLNLVCVRVLHVGRDSRARANPAGVAVLAAAGRCD